MKAVLLFLFIFFSSGTPAQQLHLRQRPKDALSGSAFAKSISDSSLTLTDRENRIFEEISKGNVPAFLRKLVEIKDTMRIENKQFTIRYFVLPDYFAIGSNEDFFYCPMTPMLAQRIADLTRASLPTKKIADVIYKNAGIKLSPLPIPPTKAMTTVPVFLRHNEMVNLQLDSGYKTLHLQGALTAGNKKDIIISNKIYGEPTPRVVIYGWHKLDGKAIQPVYNKHTNTWADYSHGVRLIQQRLKVNGKWTTLKKVLSNPTLAALLSDEGVIVQPRYQLAVDN